MASILEEQLVESLSCVGQKLCVRNFIWSEEEWPAIDHNSFANGDDDIPVISLQGVFDERKDQEYDNICQEMVNASAKWGFFKLVDHGIALETIEKFKVHVNEFFALSMEQKMKAARSTNLPLGYSASNPDYGKNLPWAEIIQLLQSQEQVVSFARKVYDDQYQPFSNALMEYMQALDKLGMIILEMLAHGLGLPRDFFLRNFEAKEETILRVNKYPPCPIPEKCLGLGSHSDPHTLTILLQDDVGGLQVLKNDNQWIGVCPVLNSFVINLGDTLEAWTNGNLKSVVHRAVVNKEKSRLSAAYFLSPNSRTIIDSLPQFIDLNTNPRKYRPFTWGDFRKQLLSQKRVVGKTALNRYHISKMQ
ncbi:Gibberellin 20 oxidase, putative [Ricinus communis]|uniref:Gibberellin 20 oxidase, putative n=1 Tax=Ricinus communis TaxID=3988 RepID=B9T282_RICCO|nr:Gibberellin 20 oxidase, putative [Ricinus communis]|eukprot:XP_002532351.1 gibberellin 20 oxidase 1 [Ricinus communis]